MSVVDHVCANPGDDLSLDSLASLASFSPYHFHRIFSAETGESLGRFVQRTRLEAAARILRSNPATTVTDAAFACGFASLEGL